MPEANISQFTSVFKTDDFYRVRRNRPALSCTACQRRKSKCDRQHPCSACLKRDDIASCHFDKSLNPVGDKKELQSRLSKLEQLVRGLADSSSSAASSNQANEQVFTGDHVFLQGGQSVGDGPESSYHGATSWAALMNGIQDIQSLLAAERDSDEPSSLETAHSEGTDFLFGDLPPIRMDDVVYALPSRQDADRLITAYFRAKFVALPYLHVHQFRRRYESFWQNPQSVDFLWISILFSVLALGSSFAKNNESPSHTLPTVSSATDYLFKSAQCLIAGHYLRAKPLSVEAVIIHAHCRNIHKVDADATLWSLYGVAVRLAQKRGYHRDPARISLQLSPFEAEMRRRVWFVIQSSDLLFSFQHGMPSIIDDALCDVKPPSVLTDDDFDENTTALPPSRPPTDPIPNLAYSHKATLACLMRRVMRHVLQVEPQPYKSVLALHDEHEKWYAGVPPCLRIRTIAETAFTDHNYTIMHRLMLDMMYRKSLCVLHRPYLSAYRDHAQYSESRRICREAAVKILTNHIEFHQEMQPGGRLYEDRHTIASLTYHHFLFASMVLCIDLSQSSNDSSYDRPTHIQLLRSIYDIWTARSVESNDARHASQVLRAVLKKLNAAPISDQSTPLTDGTSGTVHSFLPENGNTPPILPCIADESVSFPVDFIALESFDWQSLDQYLQPDNSIFLTDNKPWNSSIPL